MHCGRMEQAQKANKGQTCASRSAKLCLGKRNGVRLNGTAVTCSFFYWPVNPMFMMKVEPLMWRFFIGLVPSLRHCISQTPWVLIRSIGEDSSLLLLPPPISILVYAGFPRSPPSSSPYPYDPRHLAYSLSFNTSSIFVWASPVKLPISIG